MRKTIALCTLLCASTVGCGGDDSSAGSGGASGGGSGGVGASAGAGASSGSGGSGASSGGSAGGGSGGVGGSAGSGATASCAAGSFLQSLGKTSLMVGAAMEDSVAKSAPFDARYQYIAGNIADGSGPCSSCASGCTSQGSSCANSVGCGWWGCWQYDQDPPGAFVRDFVKKVKADGQIPMITYYVLLQASGVSEGAAEVTKASDTAFMARYYADWKFLLQQIGNEVVLLHIEPDFWGYAQQVNSDPTLVPAAVAKANAADCDSLPDTLAGMGACMIAMTRKYAKNAKVSLHGSGWATKFDVLLNSDPKFDVAGHATQLGSYLKAAGADADFVTVDAADRDAAWYDTQGQDRWWDETNAALPNFTQAFAWSKALSQSSGKAIVWWQLPVGNASQGNTNDHWKDNRVDYILTHMDEVAASGGAAVLFGAGAGGQTTPSTDGGNLVSKVQAYKSGGGSKACP